MHRIRTNFILNTISQLLRIITPLITTPYVSRVLGVDKVGTFSFSLSIQSYFCLFAVLGTVAYGSREVARERENVSKVSEIFWEITVLRALTTMLALIGWFILLSLQSENRIVFLILTAYVIASFFDISWLYTGLEKFPYIVTKTIIVRVLEVICIFIFVNSPDDLPIYCAIMGGGMLLGNISLWLNLHNCIGRVRIRELKPWRHFKGVIIYFLPSVATTIYTVLDKTLIGVITKSNYENGIYEQTTKVIEIAKAITFTSLNAVLSPRSSYLYIKKQFDIIKQNLSLSIEIMLAIGFGFVFGISAVANRFVPAFFGEGYSGTVLLLRLLSPIIVIITISNALGDQYYNPAGLRLKTSVYLIIGAGTNLLFNLILIPFFKSAGAVVASLIAEAVITALYLHNCEKYVTLRQVFMLSWKKILAGIIMAGFIVLLDRLVPNTIIGLVGIIAAGGTAYLISLIVIRDHATLYVINEVLSKIKKPRQEQS